MTEKEYALTKNLVILDSVARLLSDIYVPEDSPIKKDELGEIEDKISEWRQVSYNRLNLTEDPGGE